MPKDLTSTPSLSSAADDLHKVCNNINSVVLGKEVFSKLTVLALVSGGHVLIEDIPGVGKTSLVSALASSVSCEFSRIQFTPDIMPSDITGFSIYNQKTGEFEFRPGAAMSNFVLADEINRASAKAQASLLEVMEEKQITIDSSTYKMKEPFMVLATQNPIDNLGTYPLPEAQIDRFQIRISLGYPSYEEELKIMSMRKEEKEALAPVVQGSDILRIRHLLSHIKVSQEVKSYILDLISATRAHKDLALGSSPRGSIALYRMTQALALYEERDFVLPDDVKFLAPYVLAHRVILSYESKMKKINDKDIIHEILESVKVPM